MSKVKLQYVCQTCGHASPKWLGRCPACGEWNTFVEEAAAPTGSAATSRPVVAATPIPITEVGIGVEPRTSTGIGELDRVLGGGLVSGSLVLVGGDPGIGKCLTGDTRVFNPVTGAYLPIAELAANPGSVLTLDERDHKLTSRRVVSFHNQGTKPVVRVTTRLGRILRCTPGHPVLTPDGWRSVGQLRSGTRVATASRLAFFGKDPLPEPEIKMIAYALSDGSGRGSVTTSLPEIEEDLREVGKSFGLEVRVYAKNRTRAKEIRLTRPRGYRAVARDEFASALRAAQENSGISWGEWARRANVSYGMLLHWRHGRCVPKPPEVSRLANAIHISVSALSPASRDRAGQDTGITRLMKSLGLRSQRAATKSVPECVFQLPRNQLALFLKVLFSCDGSVYVNRRARPGVSYATISLRLAQDVQHLLLRFGFVAKLRFKQSVVSRRSYTAYEVQILGVEQVKRFLVEIGIWGRDTAREMISRMDRPRLSSTHFGTIPTGEAFWDELRRVTGQLPFPAISAKAGVTIKNRRHGRPLTRRTFDSLARAWSAQLFDFLGSEDIFWDEIESIEEAGEEHVYDLTIDQTANFVANDLIVHNSTLLLAACSHLSEEGRTVVYVSGEESAAQIKLRAQRLGVSAPSLLLLAENDLEAIIAACETIRPTVMIVDSIQTVHTSDVASAPGSVAQVRECAAALMRLAKGQNITVLIVGHVTKEGQLAGPRVLEHIVDTVLYFEGDQHHAYRILRATKNRFGSTNEIGVFEMRADGLREVANPSAAFLSERAPDAPGSAVVCALEGTRPVLLEVQALVTPTVFGMPRRTAAGVDYNRMVLMLAVLEKRAGLHLSSHDVYASVAGGVSVDEPAIDLGLAAAVASSLRDRPVDATAVAIGEIGLAGEVRTVPQAGRRLAEAARLGFQRVVIAHTSDAPAMDGIEVIQVTQLAQALAALIP